MRSRVRVSTSATTEDGRTFRHRSSTKAEGEQIDIYFALRVRSQILGTRKVKF